MSNIYLDGLLYCLLGEGAFVAIVFNLVAK
jgi:hypothetical protein